MEHPPTPSEIEPPKRFWRPSKFIWAGIICFLIPFALSATAALLSISGEQWAYDAGKTLFIGYIYARFYFRWIGTILLAIGVIWLIIGMFRKETSDGT